MTHIKNKIEHLFEDVSHITKFYNTLDDAKVHIKGKTRIVMIK